MLNLVENKCTLLRLRHTSHHQPVILIRGSRKQCTCLRDFGCSKLPNPASGVGFCLERCIRSLPRLELKPVTILLSNRFKAAGLRFLFYSPSSVNPTLDGEVILWRDHQWLVAQSPRLARD